MIINRHNYEEFFILYWDNELTADEKKQVEVFVQENKDLQEEFRLFGETRFAPEANILFKEKELLLSNKNSLINFSNYPEHLLSYIDDELTKIERTEVEKFVGKHPAVQQELALLLKTKLQPETEIVFPDKSVLYRKEEKVRIIALYWRRLAVAAIILLMAGLVTFRIINNTKKDGQPEIANVVPPKENKADENNPVQVLANQDSKQQEQKKAEDKKIKKSQFEKRAIENPVVALTELNKNNLPEQKKTSNESLIASTTTNTQPDETVNPEFKKANNDAIAIAEPDKKNNLFDNSTVTIPASPSFTNYTPVESGKENESKGGLKGFLRKATRVFEHRTNIKTTTDDNKLLVGVFAVSLK